MALEIERKFLLCSHQRRYYNCALAKRPFDSWDQP